MTPNLVRLDRWTARLELEVDGVHVSARLERCVGGRLRDAYPVGEHDVEVMLDTTAPGADRSAILRDVVAAVEHAYPACRRVLVATEVGDLAELVVIEAAGFRYVLDVDLAHGSFSLSVAEPEWVANVDLASVPGT